MLRTAFLSILILTTYTFAICIGIVYDHRLCEFEYSDYESAIEKLIQAFEKNSNKSICPGSKGTIALRIYTYSGPGLCTPQNLVLALSANLMKHGFKKENIFIIGDSEASLTECDYIPSLSKRSKEGLYFHGMPVFWINDKQFHNKNWFYASSLTVDHTFSKAQNVFNNPFFDNFQDSQKSYLPTILMFGTDFWINLPVYIAHFDHGVIGSLIQSSIFNISNNKRFIDNPTNCASAAVEISAIPELKNNYLFTITSLERFQYADTLVYNANYTKSFHRLFLSTDMIALDSLCTSIINRVKGIYGHKFLHTKPLIVKYAELLKLGSSKFNIIKVK